MEENKTFYTKRGYLQDNFRLFHIRDRVELNIDAHYHEFYKVLIFLSGKVNYLIEGKTYSLKAGDILLIGQYDVHKPIIDLSVDYERIVMWVNREFLEKIGGKEKLNYCFEMTQSKRFHLIRIEPTIQNNIKDILYKLENSLYEEGYAKELLSISFFIQFLIEINRLLYEEKVSLKETIYCYDKQIEDILIYLNQNLKKDLSISHIAKKFYISPSHLMHKFKTETGYTVHKYIQMKRLMLAVELLKEGILPTQVCLECGFSEYSAFSRAFQKIYHISPGKFA